MNWILLGISAVTAMILTSCGGVGNGESVDEPTTDQMSQLDQKWGLPDRKTHPRNMTVPSNEIQVAPDPQTAPAEPPAPAQPAPQSTSSTLSLDPEPPRLDAGTIKKLQ